MRNPFLSALTMCVAVMFPGVLTATDWNFDKTLTTGVVYTDNVNLQPDGDSDLVFDVQPRIGFNRQGRRIKVSGSYRPSFIVRTRDGASGSMTHDLSARGTAELAEDVFFVDASARAGLTSVTSGSTLNPDGINSDSNTSQYFTFTASPYTRHHLGRYADVTTRLSLDTLQFDNNGGSDSDSGTFSVNVQSGRHFANLPWSIAASHNFVDFGSTDDTRNNITGSIRVPAHRRFTYTASVGYENNNVRTSRDDTDGITWSVGGIWTPNRRTSGQVSYGERYFGNNWDVSFSHRSRKTRITARYSEEVTNVRNTIINIEDGFLLDPVNNTLIPIQIPVASLINEDFLNRRVSLGVVLTGKRTSTVLSGGWSNRVYEVSGNEEDIYDASAQISRRLSNRLSGNLNVSWEDLQQSTANADRTTYLFTIGLSRSVGRLSSVSVDLSHRNVDGDAAGDYEENRVSASFSTQFL